MAKIICIDGIPGSGKSTALEHLSKLGYNVCFEKIPDWDWMMEYYNEQSNIVTTCLIDILNSFTKIYTEFLKLKDDEVIFVERSWFSFLIFAKKILDSKKMSFAEFQIIQSIQKLCCQFPVDSTIVIFLHTTPDECLQRLMKKNQPYLQSNSLSCLKKIENSYGKQSYHDSFKPEDHILINGHISPKMIVGDIITRLSSHFENLNKNVHFSHPIPRQFQSMPLKNN